MSATCAIVSAEAIQKTLNEGFAYDNMAPDSHETLRHILSPENVAGAQVKMITDRPSKTNPVKVIWDQRLGADDVNEGRGECVVDNDECDLSETYNFDTTDAINSAFSVSPIDLAGTTEENSAFVARKLLKHIGAVDAGTSRRLAETIAAEYGAWSTDTANIRGAGVTADILQVNDYIGTTGNPNPVLAQQIRRAMGLTRIKGGVIAGGSAILDYFERAFSRGQAQNGWDITEMVGRYGFRILDDLILADELATVGGGATNAAIGLGGVIPLVFNLFANSYNAMNDSTNVATVIYSPWTGLPLDLKINRACAEDPWSITVTATTKFITMPDELYKAGDRLEGVKNLALINVTCDDLTPCQA